MTSQRTVWLLLGPAVGEIAAPRLHRACVRCPQAQQRRPLCDTRGGDGAARPTTEQNRTRDALPFSASGRRPRQGGPPRWCLLVAQQTRTTSEQAPAPACRMPVGTQGVLVSVAPQACIRGAGWRVDKAAAELPTARLLSGPTPGPRGRSPCSHNAEPNGCSAELVWKPPGDFPLFLSRLSQGRGTPYRCLGSLHPARSL